MVILGIETSFDETAAAVVADGQRVMSSIVATSAEMHKETGGIIPERAAREQVRSIIPVIGKALSEAFKEAQETPQKLLGKVDAIAVTYGPGLVGSLLVGTETAKTLAVLAHKPIIPVNHLAAHLFANWIGHTPELPAVGVVVSGGHSDIVLMKSAGEITLLGATRDDAAGEAFDKCARLLGLSYPGGPAIAESANAYLEIHKDEKLSLFPRPLSGEETLDFSFSGLKTAVSREVSLRRISKTDIPRLAAEVQEAIVDSIVEKTSKACSQNNPMSILLAGGVAANKRLREKLRDALEGNAGKLYIPEPVYCTDNAVTTAALAYYLQREVSPEKVNVDPELTITDVSI